MNAERDAVYRHYIQLHPDDFPPPGKPFFFFLCNAKKDEKENDSQIFLYSIILQIVNNSKISLKVGRQFDRM